MNALFDHRLDFKHMLLHFLRIVVYRHTSGFQKVFPFLDVMCVCVLGAASTRAIDNTYGDRIAISKRSQLLPDVCGVGVSLVY